ncbi:glycosyltransferase [Flavobacteriaceae bacterium]|nr:glycosyltransferase [Flavobacteriaceae bacterium]
MVSVIVPNYNHSTFLKNRLDSIFNQTYQDFEVILLDDASTDGSVDILNQFSNHEKVSHFIVNEINSGSPFRQWAKGLQLARGEYIWIAESDDYADLRFLEETVNCFKQNVTLVFSSSLKTNENSDVLAKWNNDFDLGSQMSFHTEFSGRSFVQKYMLSTNSIPNISGVLFKKPINLHYKCLFNIKDSKYFGDWLFYIFLLHSGSVVFLNKPLNYHRIHEKSVVGELHHRNLSAIERIKLKLKICLSILITLNLNIVRSLANMKSSAILLIQVFKFLSRFFIIKLKTIKSFISIKFKSLFEIQKQWRILNSSELEDVNRRLIIKNAFETLDLIKASIRDKKKGGYFRFGDGDINLMMGKDDMLHKANRKLQKEMRQAFKINVGNNHVGLPIYSDLFGYEDGMSLGIHKVPDELAIKYLAQVYKLVDIEKLVNSFALHMVAMQNRDYCINFLQFIKSQKPIFVGNEEIKDSVFKALFNHEFIKTPKENSYSKIDYAEKTLCAILNKSRNEFRLIVVAMGCPGRIFQKRILNKGYNVYLFDFGSLLDAFNGVNSRDWIHLTGGLNHYQDILEKI